MGGKQSRDRASQSRALFSVRSSSLDSISTSVSQRTLQSTGSALPHSPSLDAISQQHAEPNGKMTTKDAKGNYYVLLETASVATTECEVPSVSPAEKEEAERDGFAPGESGDKSATQRHSSRGGLESVGTAAPPKSSKRNDGNRPTLSLPADGEKCVSGGGGVSTRRATELASRKDSRLQSTNKSKLVQRVLPTRSHSSRTAVKPGTAVVAQEQREMEREVQELLKSMLKQQQQEAPDRGHTQTTSASTTATASNGTPPTTTSAKLPESLLQCSQQELNHLASYICHTIKDTLQNSLVEQALTAQQKKSTTGKAVESSPSSEKHVQISEDPVSIRTVSATNDGSESSRHSGGGSGAGSAERGGAREPEESVQRRRNKRARRERPLSSPGVYCDEEDPHVHFSDPQTTQGLASGTSSHSPSHELQSQTHSNEESYYHRCGGGDPSPKTSTSCRACREHRRKLRSPNADEPLHRAEQRRKRGGRSKDVPVDVSLDDNCPGVNFIRRRPTHRHVVCDNCLQSLGKDAVCGRQGRRPRQKQPTAPLEVPAGSELQLSPHDDRHEVPGVGEGSGFITLYQLRTVAQILRESSGGADENVVENDRVHRKSFGPPKSQSFRHDRRHNQYRAKGQRKSVAFDDCLSVAQATELDTEVVVGPSSPERLSHLKELAYPTKSRSGRDSPATDMAVIDLSVDSPCMLQPLNPGAREAAGFMIQDARSLNKITHLHHHYHHVIHHGEP